MSVYINISDRLSCYDDNQMTLLQGHLKDLTPSDIAKGAELWAREVQNYDNTPETLPMRIIALRYLLHKLRREAIDVVKKQELVDYLTSVNINEECSSSIADILLDKSFLRDIPKTIKILPRITSLNYKIDFTLCDGNSDYQHRVRVLLLLKLSNGSSCAFFASQAALSRLLALTNAARRHTELLQLSVDNYNEELRLKQIEQQ